MKADLAAHCSRGGKVQVANLERVGVSRERDVGLGVHKTLEVSCEDELEGLRRQDHERSHSVKAGCWTLRLRTWRRKSQEGIGLFTG